MQIDPSSMDLEGFINLATLARDAAQAINDMESVGYWNGSIDTATALIGAVRKGIANAN